jgi:hypothetical protein
MSTTDNNMNMTEVLILPYTPSNRGYIIDGRKFYGKQNSIDNAENVKLISSDKHIHTWVRRGYVESILNKNELDVDALCNSDGSSRKLVTSRSMMPCPAELYNSGLCLDRRNSEHLKYYYHFSKYKNGHIVTDGDMVECRYNKEGRWKCWERNNGLHCNVFYHKK